MRRLSAVTGNAFLACLIAFSCTVGLVPGGAQGAVVSGLSEALVPVDDRSDTARAAANEAALRQVLIKISGDRKAVSSRPELLKDAGNYVLQYQYRDLAAEDGGAATSMLWVQFDEAAVRQLLANAGLQEWQSDRPQVLVWAATEQDGASGLSGAVEEDPTTRALRQHMERRGLPLVLPQPDPADTDSLTVADIKQGDTGRLRQASGRYGSQELATAVLGKSQDGAWRGRFTLLRGERSATWVAQGPTLDDVVAQGVDQWADALAAPAAAAGSATTTEAVDLQVEGITNSRQFGRAEAYLRTVPGVSQVSVRRLEPGVVTFRVIAAGGMPVLGQAIGSGQVLQPAAGTAAGRFILIEVAPPSVAPVPPQ
jgi:hypothetical protein